MLCLYEAIASWRACGKQPRGMGSLRQVLLQGVGSFKPLVYQTDR
jgi:hypothetical protein